MADFEIATLNGEKVVLAPGDRILRQDDLQALADKQQADIDAVAAAKAQLNAGDAEAVADLVLQTADRLQNRVQATRERADALEVERGKLAGGDQPTIDNLVGKAVESMSRRITRLTAAKDRVADLLNQLATAAE